MSLDTLRAALLHCADYVRHHHNASGWWNDRDAWNLIKDHIEPMINLIDSHNRRTASSTIEDTSNRPGPIYLLLTDGRLFGPFKDRSAALYWTAANELSGFSTYDLFAPGGRL